MVSTSEGIFQIPVQSTNEKGPSSARKLGLHTSNSSNVQCDVVSGLIFWVETHPQGTTILRADINDLEESTKIVLTFEHTNAGHRTEGAVH